MKNKLILIDSNSVIHRAYHALPPLTDKKGENVNAVYGSLLVFFRVLSEFNPNYIVAAFDLPGKTFRHRVYPQYKAQRVKAPEDLYMQIDRMKEVLRSFGVFVAEKEDYEADDVIGTIASSVPKDTEVIVVSGDLDVLQLAEKNIRIYSLRRGVKDISLYGEEEVKEKYEGVSPKQVVEMKALKGDASDNIPGVSGIGEKTAISLIKQFGSLEKLYSSLDSLSSSLREKLEKDKENAFMSRDLSLIKKDVPLNFRLQDSLFCYNEEKVFTQLNDLNFQSLKNRIPQRETGKLL